MSVDTPAPTDADSESQTALSTDEGGDCHFAKHHLLPSKTTVTWVPFPMPHMETTVTEWVCANCETVVTRD